MNLFSSGKVGMDVNLPRTGFHQGNFTLCVIFCRLSRQRVAVKDRPQAGEPRVAQSPFADGNLLLSKVKTTTNETCNKSNDKEIGPFFPLVEHNSLW